MVHLKKLDDPIEKNEQLFDSKKDLIALRKRPAKPLAPGDPRNDRKRSGSGVVVNSIVSVALFLCLVQWFDPTTTTTTTMEPPLSETGSLTRSKGTTQEGDVSIGRERILSLLRDAGISNDGIPNDQIEKLPKWNQVVDLYGNDVVIVGKEDCKSFCARVPKSKRRLAVAGLFNTGTNLLDTHMAKNIQMELKSIWQVPWGKHRMADVKGIHTAKGMDIYSVDDVLPVVIIRDPFSWLHSMCAQPYAAYWRRGKHHCPNLVPNPDDKRHFHDLPQNKEAFDVTVKFDTETHVSFDSLVHLWSEWYAQYLHVDYPILMIRYEDLFFQPVTVLNEIAQCVEGTVKVPIQYQVASSKSHGSGTDFMKALIKTANAKGRPNNMTLDDLEYARQHLDNRLMTTFRYNVPLL